MADRLRAIRVACVLILAGALTVVIAGCRPGAERVAGAAAVVSDGSGGPAAGFRTSLASALCDTSGQRACYAEPFGSACRRRLQPVVDGCEKEVDTASRAQTSEAGTRQEWVSAVEACIFRTTEDQLEDARGQVAVCMFQRQKARKNG